MTDPRSVAPVPRESLAFWKRTLKLAPVDVPPPLVTVELKDVDTFTFVEVGLMEPAVRFAADGADTVTVVHAPQLFP